MKKTLAIILILITVLPIFSGAALGASAPGSWLPLKYVTPCDAEIPELRVLVTRRRDEMDLSNDSVDVILQSGQTDENGVTHYYMSDWLALQAGIKLDYLVESDEAEHLTGRASLIFCIVPSLNNTEALAIPKPIGNGWGRNEYNISFSFDADSVDLNRAALPLLGVQIQNDIIVLLPASYGFNSFTANVKSSGSGIELEVLDESGAPIDGLTAIIPLKYWEELELGKATGSAVTDDLYHIPNILDFLGVSAEGQDYVYSSISGNRVDAVLYLSTGGSFKLDSVPQKERAEDSGNYQELAAEDPAAFIEELRDLAGEGTWLIDRYLEDLEVDTEDLSTEDVYFLYKLAVLSRFGNASLKLGYAGREGHFSFDRRGYLTYEIQPGVFATIHK